MNNKFEIAKQELKKTFYGIDEQIDQVIKSFETWESIKEYQVRPMTVCLWGLTGTGKTALLNRTIELLDLNKKKFYIKFGTKTSGLACDFELNECKFRFYHSMLRREATPPACRQIPFRWKQVLRSEIRLAVTPH